MVLRLLPGSQSPRRRFEVENARKTVQNPKGYRIVTSLDPRVSAIERELSERGISCFMPAEFRAVRSRTKANLWTMRRNALLPGYIFVSGNAEWRSIPGVFGLLHDADGNPLLLSAIDMMSLRTAEANSEAAAEHYIEQQRREAVTGLSKSARRSLKLAKRRFVPGSKVRILWGKEAGRDAVVQGWSDAGKVQTIIERLDAAEVVDLPHDFIRRSDEAA